ncbi:MAG TPA: DoxX family protein [Bacteroidia bacterium]|nr:DoxX family protein [Bacteroidia bacterium]
MIPVETREVNIVLLVRVFLGILFFLQGYDKVFRMGVAKVVGTIHTPLADKGVPNTFSIIGAYFTSYVELICGALLIVGFLKYYCLYLLGIDLLFAAFAFGLVEPMWDMKHIFPRLALLIFLLMVPAQWDIISVDRLWSFIKFIKTILYI